MQYIHKEVNLSPGDCVSVTLDKQANVRLMSESNYQNYRSGRRFSFHGGLAKKSPITLYAPSAGRWHVVVDLMGYRGSVNASIRVI